MYQEKLISALRSKKALLTLYGATHCLVDAACAALIFGLLWQPQLKSQEYFFLVVGYNILAFAFQPLFGLLSDKLGKPSIMAGLGIAMTGSSIVISPFSPIIAVGLAGIGNACFHVGGGAIALTLSPGRAGPSGLFVAPGALGLAIGGFIGKNGPILQLPFCCLLFIALYAVIKLKAPYVKFTKSDKPADIKWPIAVGSFLLISIMVRSLVGFSAGAPWQDHKVVLYAMVCAVFAGKALGGIISDRFGWRVTSTIALLACAPLLACGLKYPFCAISGMLLLQMTMPVTLAALYALFPRKPAFAFGAACLALIIGAAPIFTHIKHLFISWQIIGACALISAAVLFTALFLLQGGQKERHAFPAKLSV
jgi:FSR family fosmidomycin resistance protein-like MFS transporter